MARVYTVKHARKPQGKCGKCGDEINKGDPYRWFAPGYHARKQKRCMKSTCTPRASDLTTSTMSEVYAAQEAFEDAQPFTDTDELRSAFEEYTESIRSYADDRRYGADQWEYGNSMLEEAADAAEQYADELESHYIEDFDEDEPQPEDDDDPVDYEEAHEEWEQRRQEHLDTQVDEASELVSQGIGW